MRTYPLAVLGLVGLIITGCGKSESSSSSPAPDANSSTTAPSDAATAAPKVGVPYGTEADYKPVVGKYGGRLVRSTLGEPKSFNPIVNNETSTSDFTNRIFEGLTRDNPYTGKIEPMLAESWTTSDDGLVWTFRLRKDVVFNDGTPFTSADVVFTFNDAIYDMNRPAGKEPRWPCSLRDMWMLEGKPIKVEAVDDYTVKFTTPIRFAIWDNQLVNRFIISKKKYEQSVRDGAFGGAMGTESKPEDLVGTGPWMLESYVRGDRVTLKRNPRYWRKDTAGNPLPYLDQQVWLGVRDVNAMLLNFQQKISDVYYLMSGKEVPILRPKQQEDNFTLYQHGADFANLFLQFNMNLDAAKQGKLPEYKVNWFRDQRFRQAVSYAIDRRAIVQNVYRGIAYAIANPYTRAMGPFSYPDIPPYPYDPEKAKKLLADMGLKDTDGDGFLDDGQGHKVAFTLTTNTENTIRVEAIDFIRKDLQKVGMDVNLLPLDFNLLIDKLDTTFEWEAMVMGFTGTVEPHDGANLWYSWGRSHMWWPDEKTPSFPWEKRIDEIFNLGLQELNHDKRKELYREWLMIEQEQQPLIYLACRERVIALRNKFGNIFPSPWAGLGTPEDPLLHHEEEIFEKDATGTKPAGQ